MARYFIPYSGEKPATVLVNGHRLIFLGEEKGILRRGLKVVGGDRLEVVRTGDSPSDREELFQQIARSNEAGIVVTPPNTSCGDLLRTLEEQLPWVQ